MRARNPLSKEKLHGYGYFIIHLVYSYLIGSAAIKPVKIFDWMSKGRLINENKTFKGAYSNAVYNLRVQKACLLKFKMLRGT